jgi:hypothetical protein
MAYDKDLALSVLAGVMAGAEKLVTELIILGDRAELYEAQELNVQKASTDYFKVADAMLHMPMYPEDASVDDKVQLVVSASKLINWEDNHPMLASFEDYARGGMDVHSGASIAMDGMIARVKAQQEQK